MTSTTTNESNNEINDVVVPGEVVLTTIGVVVVTKLYNSVTATCNVDDDKKQQQKPPDMFRGRIWRIPGKSIASSTVCFLRMDTIIKRLPAAPGMVVMADLSSGTIHPDSNPPSSSSSPSEQQQPQQVLIHNYSPSTDTYIVSPHQRQEIHKFDDSLIANSADVQQNSSSDLPPPPPTKTPPPTLYTLPSPSLLPAKCAKFYPLIEDLLTRGDAAFATSSSFLTSPTASNLASTLSSTISQTTTTSTSTLNSLSIPPSLSNLLQPPDRAQLQEVINMMNNDDILTLLEKGRSRLQQLINDEIPELTTTALKESGITISMDDSIKIVHSHREEALKSIDSLLSVTADTNLASLSSDFLTMFSALNAAARSDRTLQSIFQSVAEQTTEWQKLSSQLLQSKGVTVIWEGAERLQARVTGLFSESQILKATEACSNLTKSFTEGDAAMARLKGLELGDAVKSRLMSAIELRSGSQGGLDAIIADAMTSFSSTLPSDNVTVMVSQLQQSASGVAKSAHETLIGVLGRRSVWREVGVLRIENTLVDLEGNLEGDLGGDEIARIARGEIGTAAIFDPIAKKAMKEIMNQLDLAEQKITDPTVLSILTHVRSLLSGDLSVNKLMDDVVMMLNDDAIVGYGEGMVERGERMLDALEGGIGGGGKVLEDLVGMAEKAGLTKDAVIGQMENLDINKLMDTAETAISDEAARKQMLSSAADSALDFLLRILPSMPVPPFDGVREGLVYHLSNLSMEGFKVRKENIIVEIAGIRAKKEESDKTPNDTPADTSTPLKTKTNSMSSMASSVDSFHSAPETFELPTEPVKATELLVIDVQSISAIFKDPVWSFEQTYFPYLKGSGTAFVELFDGSIRLQFELRKRKVDDKWEPTLCLHEHTCAIGELTLTLKGEGRITWMVNKLASYFKGPLRNYVVKQIISVLGGQSGKLLKMLNENLEGYWEIILRTAGLTMDDLAELTTSDLTEAPPDPTLNEIELVWREHLPLGMNLLMNDDSGLLKVVDFPRGSQARKVATERQLDAKVFEGATITAVNGTRYYLDTQDELIEALKDPGRPKTVSFELSNAEDAERIRKFVMGEFGDDDEKKAKSGENSTSSTPSSLSIKTITITSPSPLDIEFTTSMDNFSLVVQHLSSSPESPSTPLIAGEPHPEIQPGDLLVSINDHSALGDDGMGANLAVSLLNKYAGAESRPLTLGFASPCCHSTVFVKEEGGLVESVDDPSKELILEEVKDRQPHRVILKGFNSVAGLAETGGVFIGDHLVFVNAVPVGAGCKFFEHGPKNGLEDCQKMFKDETNYPLALTFARPRQDKTSRWTTFSMETCTTFCITANKWEELGCEFGRGRGPDDIVVTGFNAVKGPFQLSLDKDVGWLGMAVEAIDGQIVPGYVTAKMVLNVLKRNWANKGRLEIMFSDDKRREWIKGLAVSKTAKDGE